MVQNPAWGRKSAEIMEAQYSTAFRVEQTNWTLAVEWDKITASMVRDDQLAGDHTARLREFRHSGPLMELPANFLLVDWLTATFLQSVSPEEPKQTWAFCGATSPTHWSFEATRGPSQTSFGKLARQLTRVYVCDVCRDVPAVSECILLFGQSRLWFMMLWGSFAGSLACFLPLTVRRATTKPPLVGSKIIHHLQFKSSKTQAHLPAEAPKIMD